MTKFIRNLAVFVAGLPFLTSRAAVPLQHAPALDRDEGAVSLRPLNLEMDNLFASHRSHSSHSSHASHSSHYSGSGGHAAPAYVTPVYVAPVTVPTPALPVSVPSTQTNSLSASGGTPSSNGSVGLLTDPEVNKPAEFTLAEKRRLQVLRVQMRLNSLKLYDGQLTGVLDGPTRASLKLFQGGKKFADGRDDDNGDHECAWHPHC